MMYRAAVILAMSALIVIPAALASDDRSNKLRNPSSGHLRQMEPQDAINDDALSVSLTSAECKALGGEVRETLACKAEGENKRACVTVDRHGVVRMMCFEVKK